MDGRPHLSPSRYVVIRDGDNGLARSAQSPADKFSMTESKLGKMLQLRIKASWLKDCCDDD
jgi:hypothetical protein